MPVLQAQCKILFSGWSPYMPASAASCTLAGPAVLWPMLISADQVLLPKSNPRSLFASFSNSARIGFTNYSCQLTCPTKYLIVDICMHSVVNRKSLVMLMKMSLSKCFVERCWKFDVLMDGKECKVCCELLYYSVVSLSCQKVGRWPLQLICKLLTLLLEWENHELFLVILLMLLMLAKASENLLLPTLIARNTGKSTNGWSLRL